jgi:hypothetical protein
MRRANIRRLIQPPPTDREAKLRQLRKMAKLLDEAVRIPGTNIGLGLDSVIGLVPVLGDALTALFAAYIVRQAAKLGAPNKLILRMLLNVALDFVGGSIPVAGDLFDVLWKANKKNLDLLEAYFKSERPPEPFIDV